MRKCILPVLLSVLLVSCSHPRNDTDQGVATGAHTSGKANIMLSSHKVHPFSHPHEMDTFRIYLQGDSILNGNVFFEITDHQGNKIYQEAFHANYLLNYDLDANATKEDKEEFIRGRIASFFDDEHFSKPAIDSDDTFEENYSVQDTWENIKADPTAIGFYYLLGKEDGRYIAYSKSKEKVVMYYNCC